MKTIFVGYSAHHRAYKLYDPVSGRIKFGRSVTFNNPSSSGAFLLSNLSTTQTNNTDIVIPTYILPNSNNNNNNSNVINSDHPLSINTNNSISSNNNHSNNTNINTNYPNIIAIDSSSANSNDSDNEFFPANESISDHTNIPRTPAFSAINPQNILPYSRRSQNPNSPIAMAVAAEAASTLFEPKTYAEAISCSDSDQWIESMKEEFSNFAETNTFNWVEPPANTNIVDSKWIYKIKLLPNNSIEKFKSRLVARGFSQVEGVDFTETFAPVVKHTTVRFLLSLCPSLKLKMKQMDVSCAFLHGDIDTDVYVKPPKGFENGTLVWKLNKALYGLKQAPRLWYQKLHDYLISNNYKCSKADAGLYYKTNTNNDEKIYIAIYVDDIKVFYNYDHLYKELYSTLNSEFKMKEIKSNQFIGIQIDQDPSDLSVSIHQKFYISKCIERFNISSNSVHTPLPQKSLIQNIEPINENTKLLYSQIVGVIIHVSRVSRPHLSYAASLLGSFLNNPSDIHLDAAKHCLSYLRTTINYKIHYHGSSPIKGYSDANWNKNSEDGRSVGGYIFILNNGCISWSSKKQKSVALSSTESEYYALSEAAKEAVFLQNLANSIELQSYNVSIPIYADNNGAISLAKNPVKHSNMKHIPIRVHFIRQLVEDKNIEVRYVSGAAQIADFLTKSVGKDKAKFCGSNSGIR